MKKTPLKSIRSKCLDCMAGQPGEVRLCPSEDCPLYPYRFGTNPSRTGVGGKSVNDSEKPEVIQEKIINS